MPKITVCIFTLLISINSFAVDNASKKLKTDCSQAIVDEKSYSIADLICPEDGAMDQHMALQFRNCFTKLVYNEKSGTWVCQAYLESNKPRHLQHDFNESNDDRYQGIQSGFSLPGFGSSPLVINGISANSNRKNTDPILRIDVDFGSFDSGSIFLELPLIK